MCFVYFFNAKDAKFFYFLLNIFRSQRRFTQQRVDVF